MAKRPLLTSNALPLSLLCALLAACIVEAPSGERASAPKSRAVVSQAPPLSVQNGANFENKVELVGATLTPGRASPGEAVKVTAFFKVLGVLDVDYIIFVHVEDADGRSERMNLDHRPAAGSYPTNSWKKGETVKDEFTVVVPAAVTRSLKVFVGFWDPSTDTRLKLSNPDRVQNDGNNRILLAQIPVGT